VLLVLKGVILAAGQGTRMSSITYNSIPKELLPIGNVPTIRFPIEALKLAGINKIMVVIAPQTKHGIIDGLQSGKRFGTNLCYFVQEKPENGSTGIGVAVLSIKSGIEDEDFIVACGDTILCNFSLKNPLRCLKPLLDIHSSVDAIATILVHPIRDDPSRFGVVKFRDFIDREGILYGEIDSLVEKPDPKIAENYKMNSCYFTIAGYYAFKPKIFEYIERTKPGVNNEVQITDSISLALENGERVYAVINGMKLDDNIISYKYWDVGVPEDYKNANKYLSEMEIEKFLVDKTEF
jgi:dTDP-glucose pyrophosphorylase